VGIECWAGPQPGIATERFPLVYFSMVMNPPSSPRRRVASTRPTNEPTDRSSDRSSIVANAISRFRSASRSRHMRAFPLSTPSARSFYEPTLALNARPFRE